MISAKDLTSKLKEFELLRQADYDGDKLN